MRSARVRRSMTSLGSAAVVAVVAGAMSCAAQQLTQRQPPQHAPEALYLSVEVQHDGRTVARPKVLGFEGKNITVERRQPDAPVADYRLMLVPKVDGAGYGVGLDLELGGGRRHGHVGLLHGEERKIDLGDDIELKVMLMRVDSPEFRALVRAPTRPSNTI